MSEKNQSGIIYLIGFSGSGKSTIGPMIAKRLKVNFYDIDSVIEKENRKKISEIFTTHREKFFRSLEKSAIERITANRYKNKVIALGGGAFENVDTRKLVIENGISIYLSCSIREIIKRLKNVDNRPLLIKKEAKPLQELYEKRRYNYKLADLTVSTTTKTKSQVVKEIIKKLG